MPAFSDSPESFDFSFLFRGFVPLELVGFLSVFLTKPELFRAISTAVYETHSFFHSHTWSTRCAEVKDLEVFHNLVRDYNAGCDPSAFSLFSSSFSSLSVSVPSVSVSNSWVGWIGDLLSSGSCHILEGFRLHINASLF